jgi:hypothetical protein
MAKLSIRPDATIVYHPKGMRMVFVPGSDVSNAPFVVQRCARSIWDAETVSKYHDRLTEAMNGAGPNTGTA